MTVLHLLKSLGYPSLLEIYVIVSAILPLPSINGGYSKWVFARQNMF
jgi:hypothetical protein